MAGAGKLLTTLDKNDTSVSKYPTEEKREVGKGKVGGTSPAKTGQQQQETTTFKLKYCCPQLINHIFWAYHL
jgi:hypothetical protein